MADRFAFEDSRAEFEATPWSMLEALRGGDEALAARVESRLAMMYWPAIFACLRRQGRNRHDAAEITQDFFVNVVLGRGIIRSAVKEKGRLRSLIRVALRNYCIDRVRHMKRLDRMVTLSEDQIDREERLLTEETAADAEAAFDRRWALSMVEAALDRAEAHFRRAGKSRHWELYDATTLRRATRNVRSPRIEDLARDLGFASAGDARAALQVVRERVQAIVAATVAEHCGQERLEEELQTIREMLQ